MPPMALAIGSAVLAQKKDIAAFFCWFQFGDEDQQLQAIKKTASQEGRRPRSNGVEDQTLRE